MAGRTEVLQLYKSMMREGAKFTNYNFRMYALRKVKDSFRSKRNVTDAKEIEDLLAQGQENLEILRRQVLIDHLYKIDHLVIDKAK